MIELESAAWDRYLRARTSADASLVERLFGEWRTLWRARIQAGLVVPEGAW